MSFFKKHKTIGLALSGGGARGYAHIGVLKALEERQLNPEIISGTSIGAVIGALIANGYTADELIDLARKYGTSKIFDIKGWKLGLSSHKFVREILVELLPATFEELKLPFFVAASNLNKAALVEFKSGNLIDAILASISIPLVFKPMMINGESFVDGGLFKNLPASFIRKQSDILIGSHVNRLPMINDFTKTTELINRCIRIGIANTLQTDKDLCDIFIDPKSSSEYSVLDFKAVDEIIEIGYNAANEVLVKHKA